MKRLRLVLIFCGVAIFHSSAHAAHAVECEFRVDEFDLRIPPFPLERNSDTYTIDGTQAPTAHQFERADYRFQFLLGAFPDSLFPNERVARIQILKGRQLLAKTDAPAEKPLDLAIYSPDQRAKFVCSNSR